MGILAVVIGIMTRFAKLNGYNNYKDTYRALYPKPWMEIFFEIFYIVIIVAGVASAVSGAGNVLTNFLGLEYVGSVKIIANLIIVVILIILTIFGVKLVIAASTILSIGIIVTTIIMVITGLAADVDGIAKSFLDSGAITELADYTHEPATALWRGVFIYLSFQCVSIAPMISASEEMSVKGTAAVYSVRCDFQENSGSGNYYRGRKSAACLSPVRGRLLDSGQQRKSYR